MTPEMTVAFCALVVLTGASRTEGESSARPLVLTSTVPVSHPGSSVTEKDPRLQRKHHLPDRNETSAQTTTMSQGGGAELQPEAGTDGAATAYTQREIVSVSTTANTGSVSSSAAAHNSLSTGPTAPTRGSTTEGRPLLTSEPPTNVSSQPTLTDHDASPTAPASTTRLQPVTTGSTQTSAPGWGPAGPTHREVPSELNVGDEELKGPRYRSNSTLDPLLAGLLSVFIVTTAIVFVVIFLKFRQRTNHPEFHRLQDLPMDDLMEDTPLSRYTY